MIVQVYNQYSAQLTITVSTQRVEAAPSHRFVHAKFHEDMAGSIRLALKEWKHTPKSTMLVRPEFRISTYFPQHEGSPYYALNQLMPAGAPRDVDQDFQLELTRLQFALTIDVLGAARRGDEILAEGLERNVEYAAAMVLRAQQVPFVFIPGDEGTRPESGTDVDILCQLGPATARTGVEKAPQS